MRWMDCQRETDSITRFNVKAAVAVVEEGSSRRAGVDAVCKKDSLSSLLHFISTNYVI